MQRRSWIIAFHWATFLMLLAMIKGGSAASGLRWAFVAVAGIWCAMAIVKGLAGRPGPKLQGAMRTLYPWSHRGMYALLGLVAVLNLGALLNITPMVWAWNTLLLLLVTAIFHAIFHLWRHTSLNDGALRMMTPKMWHKYL